MIILSDSMNKETVQTEEINLTHQLMTSLHQKAGPVIASASLYRNVVDRQQRFKKKLKKKSSIESEMVRLYQETNEQIAINQDVSSINSRLSMPWYKANFPQLSRLKESQVNQLHFNFFCYQFFLDMKLWNIYNPSSGVLLFLPTSFVGILNTGPQVLPTVIEDKKENMLQALQSIFLKNEDQWIIYLSGHGHMESRVQEALVAGFSLFEFQQILQLLNDTIKTKLLVYGSCYAGGVHTVKPYQDQRLKYPVVVLSLTDAPTYVFGYFANMKLPPYDNQHKLIEADVKLGKGLQYSYMQHFYQFFDRAWQGKIDMKLLQLISNFFVCDGVSRCHLHKVENIPLVRKAGSNVFNALSDHHLQDLAKLAKDKSDEVIIQTNPILLYRKKIDQIVTNAQDIAPVVSMIPGLQGYEITTVAASDVPLSAVLKKMFSSLDDAETDAIFFIKKLLCRDDLIHLGQSSTFKNVIILNSDYFTPRFIDKEADLYVYLQSNDKNYLLFWKNNSCIDVVPIDLKQAEIMKSFRTLIQKVIHYKSHLLQDDLLTYSMYNQSKLFQKKLLKQCFEDEVCR